MLPTTSLEYSLAILKSEPCPAWRAPIVGINAQDEGSSEALVTTFMAPVLSGTGRAVVLV
jgi:hypothetical protein